MKEFIAAALLVTIWTMALFVLARPVGAFSSASFGQASAALEVVR